MREEKFGLNLHTPSMSVLISELNFVGIHTDAISMKEKQNKMPLNTVSENLTAVEYLVRNCSLITKRS